MWRHLIWYVRSNMGTSMWINMPFQGTTSPIVEHYITCRVDEGIEQATK